MFIGSSSGSRIGWWVAGAVAVTVCLCGPARGQHYFSETDDWEWGIGFAAGYANITLDGGDDVFDDSDGGYAEFVFLFHPPEPDNLAFEIALGGSFAEEDIPVPDELPSLFTDADAHLSVATLPELRAIWTQPIGDWFVVEAGAGAALLVVTYSEDVEFLGFEDEDLYDQDTDVGVGVRPILRAGAQFEKWSIGGEVSALLGWVDMDELGDELNTVRAGVFVHFAL